MWGLPAEPTGTEPKADDARPSWLRVSQVSISQLQRRHGPIDAKRHGELSKLFWKCTAGLVYVTAFPNRQIMGKYLPKFAWETEVWIADAPSHLIHFNGVRFLGPCNTYMESYFAVTLVAEAGHCSRAARRM